MTLSAKGKQIMEDAGWTRIWCANSPRPLPKDMRGMSDNGYVRDGVLLFIEDKDAGGMRKSQIIFMQHILDNDNPNVLYLVAESAEDYRRYSELRKHED
jgi:hypothetical protein